VTLSASFTLGLLGGGPAALAAPTQTESCTADRHSAFDEQFLTTAIEGDRFEIKGGVLAQRAGTTDKVKALGATLAKDHAKSLASASKLARRLHIDVPGGPSPSQQWELRVVASFSGAEFDRWYSDLEVQDHKQDIQEAKDAAKMGCNAKVRQDAREELPVLRRHLGLAKEALASLGG
jgi:predicted outer membrane protein